MAIRIPDKFMGKPISGAMERILEKSTALEQATAPQVVVPANSIDGFIYVPSIGAFVAKERSFQNKNWFDAHKALHAQGDRMLTIPEFAEFLKYLQTGQSNPEYKQIFDDITAVRNPWRAEWLDADFKVVGKALHINYGHEVKGTNLQPKYSEQLAPCLMEDRKPGIDLTDWISRATKHGLSPTDVKSGSVWYWHPLDDNNSVAGFDADSGRALLVCVRSPTDAYSSLGVRAVRRASP